MSFCGISTTSLLRRFEGWWRSWVERKEGEKSDRATIALNRCWRGWTGTADITADGSWRVVPSWHIRVGDDSVYNIVFVIGATKGKGECRAEDGSSLECLQQTHLKRSVMIAGWKRDRLSMRRMYIMWLMKYDIAQMPPAPLTI